MEKTLLHYQPLFFRKCLSYFAIPLAACFILSPAATAKASPHEGQQVKLILQITVDGLRADLLNRYKKGFGKDGFRLLMKDGVYYTNAHYQYANTETIVGHATLATGALPVKHGMVGNVWFDRDSKELAYNIEDPDHPLLPTRDKEVAGAQVDPAQKKSRTQGRSPRVLLVPTFSDMLSAYYGGRSKIFGVSGKDRSAVSMAGKTGKAFWFSTNSGDFITSTYYYDAYPDWVQEWNNKRKAESYAGKSWSLLHDQGSYLLGGQDDRPYEVDLKGYGRTFPHPFGKADDKLFYTRILVSPVGDQLTLDFSKEIIINENLGGDEFTDYLSISFSGVDAVNHFFGPSSLENEDVVVQLDTVLADLFAFIDKKIGLQHTLIVLSADHGMADMPEYLAGLGYYAGRLEPDQIVETANRVGEQFGIKEVVRFFYRPYVYLDDEKIVQANADFDDVERAVAEALTNVPGIAVAAPKSRLKEVTANPVIEKIRNNHHAVRSGDIYVAQEPYWFLFDKGPVAAMHGSPWQYDTHVPILFMGPQIDRGRVGRLVHPVDVAPTLAAYLGMTPPGSSQGVVLKEVLP